MLQRTAGGRIQVWSRQALASWLRAISNSTDDILGHELDEALSAHHPTKTSACKADGLGCAAALLPPRGPPAARPPAPCLCLHLSCTSSSATSERDRKLRFLVMQQTPQATKEALALLEQSVFRTPVVDASGAAKFLKLPPASVCNKVINTSVQVGTSLRGPIPDRSSCLAYRELGNPAANLPAPAYSLPALACLPGTASRGAAEGQPASCCCQPPSPPSFPPSTHHRQSRPLPPLPLPTTTTAGA